MENLEIFGTALGTILTAIATSAATWAGTFFFYRQRKQSMELENESKQSDEWRKLYIESKEDSERKDAKIDELRREISDLRKSLIDLERKVQLNSIYRCDVINCPNRIPPLSKGTTLGAFLTGHEGTDTSGLKVEDGDIKSHHNK